MIGLLGSFFHLSVDNILYSKSVFDGIVYGPPLFAPLLLPNIAFLALLGFWEFMDIA